MLIFMSVHVYLKYVALLVVLLQHSRREGVAPQNCQESRVLPKSSLELVINIILMEFEYRE